MSLEGLMAYGSEDESGSGSGSTDNEDQPQDDSRGTVSSHADAGRRYEQRGHASISMDRGDSGLHDNVPEAGTESAASPDTTMLEAALETRLPPPPEEGCKEDVRMRVQHIVDTAQEGRNFLDDLRGKKEFNNPYILEHVVDHFGLSHEDQWASHSLQLPSLTESVDYRSLRRAQEEREAERAEWKKRRAEISFAPASALAGSVPSGTQACSPLARDAPSSAVGSAEAGGADQFAASLARAQAKAREILSSSTSVGARGYSRPR